MYEEELKEILLAVFGPGEGNLTLDSTRSGTQRRRQDQYYYVLGEELEEEIRNTRDLLNERLTGNELKKILPLTKKLHAGSWKLPICAHLRADGDYWKVAFYEVAGVRFHKTYGNRVAATLELKNRPVVVLDERLKDEGYGLWWDPGLPLSRETMDNAEGLKKKVRSCLLHNRFFRQTIIRFLKMVGERENKQVLIAMAKAIYDQGDFPLQVGYRELIETVGEAEMPKR